METTTDLLAGTRGPVLDTQSPGYDDARAVFSAKVAEGLHESSRAKR